VLRVVDGRHDAAADLLDLASGWLLRWRAKRIVLATPLFVSARLHAAPPQALRDAASRMPHAPWLVANLYVDAPLRERRGHAPRSWDNVIYGGAGLGYVDASHQDTRPYAGATVLTYFLALGDDPSAGRKLLLERDLATWCEAALADLAPAHADLSEKVRHIAIMRYGHGMAVPVPGVRGDRALAALREPRARVSYAHSDLSGYSIFEEAYHWGRRAGAATASALQRA
jgi:hypothetical protein